MLKFLNKLFGTCSSLVASIFICGFAGLAFTYFGLNLIASGNLAVIFGWFLLIVGLLCILMGIIDILVLFVKSIINKKWLYLVLDIIFIALYAILIYYLIAIMLIFSLVI